MDGLGHFAGLCVAMPFLQAGFFGGKKEREGLPSG